MKEAQSFKEPPCPIDEHNFRGCLTFVNGKLTYYINRRCKANLLWLFWFNHAKSPFGEDPSLENDFYETLTNQGHWVPYCETTIIEEEDIAGREESYPDGYRRLDERLDLYITKPEFSKAFRAIQRLGRREGVEHVTEVVIFNVMRAVLLPSAEFGKRTE